MEQVQILEDKDNTLLHRKEIKFIVKSEKNPMFDEVIQHIVDNFKANKDNLVVKLIQGKFGRNTFLVSAFVYDSKENKDKFEPKKKVKEGEEAPDSKEIPSEGKTSVSTEGAQAPAAPAPAPAEKKEEAAPKDVPSESKGKEKPAE